MISYKNKTPGFMASHLRKILCGSIIAAALAVTNACAPEAVSASAVPQDSEQTSNRPNIIVFLVDDMGWRDAGYSGSGFYDTPHIDQLAKDGMQFTQAYAAYPRCVPSRFGLMTGKNPAREQIPGGTGGEVMRASEITFAEALRDSGYSTFFAGKWHLGKRPAEMPDMQGFEINIGGGKAGAPGSYFFPYGGENAKKPMGPGLENGKPGEYLNDRLTEETISFIQAHEGKSGDKPFLAVLSHYAVHTPLQAEQKDIAVYKAKLKNMGGQKNPDMLMRDGQTKLHQDHAVYGGMVTSMDRSLGKLRASLAQMGIDNNTVIIFTSDHGGLSNRGTTSNRKLATSNLPLRGGKGHLYEGGIRVPMVVYWPGHTKPASKSDALVNGTDHYAAMLDIAGVQKPDAAVDAVSYLSVLTGKSTTAREPIYWYSPRPRPKQTGDTAGAAVRMGDWKYIRRYDPAEQNELFNLADDPSELSNLIGKNPEKATELRTMVEGWLTGIDAAEPSLTRGGNKKKAGSTKNNAKREARRAARKANRKKKNQ